MDTGEVAHRREKSRLAKDHDENSSDCVQQVWRVFRVARVRIGSFSPDIHCSRFPKHRPNFPEHWLSHMRVWYASTTLPSYRVTRRAQHL